MVDKQEKSKVLELIIAEYFCVLDKKTTIKRDVTELLKDKIYDKNTFRFYIKNRELGGDLPGTDGKHKSLYVKYFYNGVEFEDIQKEWNWMEIPNKDNLYISLMEEILCLLKELERNNSDTTDKEKINYITKHISPTLKSRLISAFKAGGDTAIKEFIENSYIKVGASVIRALIAP